MKKEIKRTIYDLSEEECIQLLEGMFCTVFFHSKIPLKMSFITAISLDQSISNIAEKIGSRYRVAYDMVKKIRRFVFIREMNKIEPDETYIREKGNKDLERKHRKRGLKVVYDD